MKPGKHMEETQMHIPKWKESIWKGYILWFPLYDILEKEKKNYGDHKKTSGC